DIIKKLRSNQTFKAGPEFSTAGLPVFADVTRYGITEAKQLELCSLEVRRLVEALNSAQPATLEGEPAWFGGADQDGYRRLSKIAKQIRLALAICSHDSQLVFLQHYPIRSDPDLFQAKHGDILAAFGPDAPRDQRETLASMKLDAFNDEVLHSVINYMTTTITQILLRTMQGGLWDDNCIITMARCAAKIKVLLAVGLDHAAQTTLAGKREWVEHMKRLSAQAPDPSPQGEEERTEAGKQRAAMARCISPRPDRYFEILASFGSPILQLLSLVNRAMTWDGESSLAPDTFETCSIVYDTGFRGKRSILCQERHGAIGASGRRGDVHCASFAFDVCLKALEDLQRHVGPQGLQEAPGEKQPSTMVYWKWTELPTEAVDAAEEPDMFLGEPRTGQLDLTSMRDIIAALVPFSMVCGPFISQLESTTQRAIIFSDRGDPISKCMEIRFLASFMISTSEYNSFKQEAFENDPDVTPVSACPIAEQRALALGPMSSSLRHRGMGDHLLRQQLIEKNKTIRAGLDVVDQFTFDNSCIIIRSRWYCWSTLTCCAILVAGGLVIGFSVNERIQGVDPFNISLFCWALAGFFTIFMKSLRVENWPWRDFFRGRVVCRSVSEVVAVSRVPVQLFLSILLRLEPIVVTNKEGPFSTIFIRKEAGSPGFSIDMPLHTASLIDAGLFFAKVQSASGPALMAIRPGPLDGYTAVDPRESSDPGEEAKCSTFEDPGKWGRGED
ncbi:hypothetical protein B0T14DRAFT_411800, partial [Immersiella caudata]